MTDSSEVLTSGRARGLDRAFEILDFLRSRKPHAAERDRHRDQGAAIIGL